MVIKKGERMRGEHRRGMHKENISPKPLAEKIRGAGFCEFLHPMRPKA